MKERPLNISPESSTLGLLFSHPLTQIPTTSAQKALTMQKNKNIHIDPQKI